ncbi:hypothetical protein WJX77_000273 [Trebouxia sp. C0004]
MLDAGLARKPSKRDVRVGALSGMDWEVLGWELEGKVAEKASWVAMGAAVRSSAVVQHSLNVFRPPSGTAFTLVRSLLVCLPFLMSAMAQVLAYTQLARVTQIAGARGYLKGASEALLKNASSSRKGSIAALAPDTDIGIY